MTTDPYGQYHSPYVGMGNNPISAFDLDGGWADWYLPIGGNSTSDAVWIDGSGEREGYTRIPYLSEAIVNRPVFSTGSNISSKEAYRRENLYYLRKNLSDVNFNDLSKATSSFAIVSNVADVAIGELAALKVGQFYKSFKMMTAAKGGYSSFNAFKSAFGSAGKGNAWHHIE